MVALKKPSVDKMQRATDSEMLKKLFGLSLLRGNDKNTPIRAIACSLIEHGYIKIEDYADLAITSQETQASCVLYCDVAFRRLAV